MKKALSLIILLASLSLLNFTFNSCASSPSVEAVQTVETNDIPVTQTEPARQDNFQGLYRVSSWVLNNEINLTSEVEFAVVVEENNAVLILIYHTGRLDPNEPLTGVRHGIAMNNYCNDCQLYHTVEYAGQGAIEQLDGRIRRVGNVVRVEIFFDGDEFDVMEFMPR